MNETNGLNVGIIGFGKMGQIRYNAINASKRGQVIAISDPYQDISLTGIKVNSTVDETMGSDNIDAVFICTPNYLNKELTIKGLESGKHIFCEKPPAFTASDVEEIIEVERKLSDFKLMYGFNHRHHGSIKKIRSILDSKIFGNVLWMRGRYGKSVDSSFYEGWRAKRELAGGGILLDQGIHMLDLFLYVADNFDEVKAFVSNLYWKIDVEDNVFAMMKNTKTGVVASLHSTMTQWRHLFSMEIFCEKGYMVLNGLKTSSNTYGDEVLSIAKSRTSAPAATWEDEEKFYFKADDFWNTEIEFFFDCIEKNIPVLSGNSADVLKLMKIVDKIYGE